MSTASVSRPSFSFHRRFCLVVGTAIVALSLAGCASTPSLSIEEIMAQYDAIDRLSSGLQDATAQDAAVLAPETYAKVSADLDAAIAAARDGNTAQANTLASAGLEGLDEVSRHLGQSRELLREVIEVRDRADEAGAAQIYPERTEKLEKSLTETATLIERGKLEDAKKRRQQLIDGYAELELSALKDGMVEAAKATIKSAEDQGAKKYARQTFESANEEMSLALSILDADRTDIDKANVHAKRAKYLAKRSAAITELIKDLDRRDFDREGVVLWYQSQLSEIYEPVSEELPFDHRNRDVVLEMKEAYATLIRQRDEVAAVQVAEAEVFQQQLELTEEQLLEKKRLDEEERIRFDTAQSSFTASEATVYRQKENVLISAHGFDFPSGQSEINADNFVLLNKVIRVIGLFPGSKIDVSGHTDSTGSAELNLSLSQKRATNVAKFLNEVGGIALDRLSSDGFGKERPLASNETAEGRAQNRRVEILIINP